MWYFEGNEVKDDDVLKLKEKNVMGFVYCITDKKTGMKYIGKKTLFSKRRLPPLKGMKRKRIKIVETDWKKYYGSSTEVQKLVEEFGCGNFHREILRFCYSKGEMSYYELKLQMDNEVLLKPDEYHNKYIAVKVHTNHVKNLWLKE